MTSFYTQQGGAREKGGKLETDRQIDTVDEHVTLLRICLIFQNHCLVRAATPLLRYKMSIGFPVHCLVTTFSAHC